ncbi:MAG: hypothetical protein MUC50_18375, partial [Myxococcota bacterium]|nr:hypothetical protein [Myxococcota bacterium]
MPQKCMLLALATLLAGIVSMGMGACEASSDLRSSSLDQGVGEGEGQGEGEGDGAGQGEGGGRCAEKGFPITEQPVDMLIVLDRSFSMQDNGYWNPMCAALRTVTAQISDKINFGLMVFPQSGCGDPAGSCEPATAPIVDIGDPSAISLIDNALSPSGVGFCEFGATPTAQTLKAAKTALAAVKSTNKRFVLLATDGAPNCNENLSCKDCTVVHNYGCGAPTHCLDDLATETAAKDLYDAGYP